MIFFCCKFDDSVLSYSSRLQNYIVLMNVFFLSKSSRHVQVNGLHWNTMSGKMPVSYMAWKHIEDSQFLSNDLNMKL